MKLFSPLSIKGMELKNRIVMSPMCMYSCENKDGKVTDWHKIHYTARAVGQVSLIVLEASAVTPQGRISEQDLGIWSDEHTAGLKEIVALIHEQKAKAAIQLAHAGRKAGHDKPIIAPSAIAFQGMKLPEEMTTDQILETVTAFIHAAVRAKEAGFDCIEIHAAHGYLINQFLSPLTNHRNDEYGNDKKGRTLFLEQILQGVRGVWEGPLFVRISANEYHPDGNKLEDFVELAALMKELGVDLIDCSSGGVVPAAIEIFPGYQVPYADKIRNQARIATGAVGMITSGKQAEEILHSNQADLIFIGRELLRDPFWPRTAAKELGYEIKAPKQYQRGW